LPSLGQTRRTHGSARKASAERVAPPHDGRGTAAGRGDLGRLQAPQRRLGRQRGQG
jgi:hypothetical protein